MALDTHDLHAMIDMNVGNDVESVCYELLEAREELARLKRLLPSEETRNRLMIFCQDQGELTPGERIDQFVDLYLRCSNRDPELSHKQIISLAMEILHVVDIRMVEIREKDYICMGKPGSMEGMGKTGAEAYDAVLERRAGKRGDWHNGK